MEDYIIDQNALAKAVDITPQYLSTIKRLHNASDELLTKLVSITGIPVADWSSPARKKQLNTKLKNLFVSERLRANENGYVFEA